MYKRVVVTGIGAVCSLGKDVKSTWSNILSSRCGVDRIPDSWFNSSDLPTKIASYIPEAEDFGLNWDDYISAKERNKTDRFIHLAHIAADQAVRDAGINDLSEKEKIDVGVLIGSGIGGLSTIEKTTLTLEAKGPRRVSPFFIPASLINLASGNVSIKYGFKGPNHSVVTACSTGAHAIGDAACIIQEGKAKVMVAGSSEAPVCRIGIAGFNAARALSTNFNESPQKASRPWDKERDGFVMGEGSGVVILEEYEHAKKRGAKIYAEFAGYGMSGDANHITAPAEDGNGAIRCMQAAFDDKLVNISDIGYINAHGTSTPLGDAIEFKAVKKIFGDHASGLLMSSTKSSIGHLLGAAGSVEAIFSILAMNDGVAPPTLNLDNVDEDCVGIDLVPHTPKEKYIGAVMSNSFGFGGTNATLIFKKA